MKYTVKKSGTERDTERLVQCQHIERWCLLEAGVVGLRDRPGKAWRTKRNEICNMLRNQRRDGNVLPATD